MVGQYLHRKRINDYACCWSLNSQEPEIAHGCNTVGLMGAGIAGVIAKQYPLVLEQYFARCKRREFHLGSALPISVMENHAYRTVWNLGTQVNPGREATIWGVMLSFGNMLEQMKAWGIDRVAIPRIGCGIGGLKWEAVEQTIGGVLKFVGAPIKVVVYTLP